MTDESEGAEARVKLADLAKAMQEVRRMQDRLHAAEAEVRKLTSLLERRDRFIVENDLWAKFVAALAGENNDG